VQAGDRDVDAYLLVALGIPPAQVGGQRRPHRVVRVQPFRGGLDVGQPAQPGEHRRGVLVAEHRAQQRLARDVRLSDDLEGAPVGRARQIAHQPLDQGGQNVAGGLPRCAGGRRRSGERKRERAAADEGHQGAALIGRHTARGEQGVGPVGVERPDDQIGEQRRPAGIQRPLDVGRGPARQHDARSLGEPGQERVPQPRLERLALLERVDQEHDAGLGTRRGGGLRQATRIGVEVPGVDAQHAATEGLRLPGGVAQQPGLADAAGPVQVRHERSVRRSGQHPVEHRPLGFPAHQRIGSRPGHPAFPSRRTHGPLLSQHHPPPPGTADVR
jgi:hypothetical protein